MKSTQQRNSNVVVVTDLKNISVPTPIQVQLAHISNEIGTWCHDEMLFAPHRHKVKLISHPNLSPTPTQVKKFENDVPKSKSKS